MGSGVMRAGLDTEWGGMRRKGREGGGGKNGEACSLEIFYFLLWRWKD